MGDHRFEHEDVRLVKRGGPLKRTSALVAKKPMERTRMVAKKPRRNDAPWRRQVEVLRGSYCRACGTKRDLQCDHVMPRSQGGPSVVENGTMLCREHHDQKTAGTILYRFEWLDEDQVAWLAQVGWVMWDSDGRPRGRGFKHFAAKRVA
jgi:5-methylcytosine-specific restriction endonuclease McrA